jgi:hypothetical protein
VASQKMIIIIVTAVETSNLTTETVFSMGSVQSAYKRSECSDRVSLRAVTSQS